MSNVELNLIAGEWTPGEGEVENRNPSDLSDLVGMYAQASAGQLDATITSIEYAGTHVSVATRITGDQEVVVTMPDRQYFEQPKNPGASVSLTWAPEKLHHLTG